MISRRPWCLIALFAVIGVACSTAAAQQKLRWDFQKGQSFAVHLQQQTSTKTKVAESAIAMDLSMVMEMSWDVDEVDDAGTAKITQQFTRLSIDVDGPGERKLSFDTASDEEPSDDSYALADSLSPLIGAKFHVEMTNRGEISNVEIPKATALRLKRSAATSRIQKLLSDASLNQLLRQSLAILPELEVKEGDTWQATSAVQSPLGNIKQEHRYKLDGVVEEDQQQLLLISVVTQLDLELPEDSKDSTQPDSNAKLDKQEQTGRLWFDPQVGRFTRSEIKQRLSTKSEYRGQPIDVQVETTTNMTFKSVTK